MFVILISLLLPFFFPLLPLVPSPISFQFVAKSISSLALVSLIFTKIRNIQRYYEEKKRIVGLRRMEGCVNLWDKGGVERKRESRLFAHKYK